MKEIVAFGKSIEDPTRVRILNILRQGEACVCELTDALELNQSTLSTHLQTLRSLGVAETEKRRTWIIYSLAENSREPIEAIFAHFPSSEPRIQRDNDRLKRRIRLRVDGCCVLGFGVLDTEKELAHA